MLKETELGQGVVCESEMSQGIERESRVPWLPLYAGDAPGRRSRRVGLLCRGGVDTWTLHRCLILRF